jgi:soluble lytic murein transglycosylase-like protein
VKYQIVQLVPYLRVWPVIGLCLVGLLATSAYAQIIDIHPDGSTATYAGPIIASVEGIRPLAPQRITRQTLRQTEPIAFAIRDAAARHQLSERLVEAVAWQESRLQQNAISPKGARGIMQLMPQTALSLGVDSRQLASNVDGGAAYLAQLMQRFDGDLIKTLAAYNAGPDAVELYSGVPPYRETRAYIDAILDRLSTVETKTSLEVRP